MKKTIVALLMSLATAAAFALPSPKAIEHALEAHDYASASSMTQEVLREKPNSAKAHLYNAYILLKQGQPAAANEELNNVNRLGDNAVKGSALYGRTVAELERPVAVQRQQRPVAAPIQVFEPSPQPKVTGFNWWGLLALTGILGGVAYLVLRKRPDPIKVFETVNSPAYRTPFMTPRPPEPVAPVRRATEYEPERRVVYQSTMQAEQPGSYGNTRMGMVGTAASVAGGVVAGNAISNMLTGGHRSGFTSDDDYEGRRRRQQEASQSSPVYSDPSPSYSSPSYESRESSYSAGSSDSYDSGSSSDSGGGGDW